MILCALVIALTLSINLGRHPLLDPDEGRNAEVGREMMVSGNYLVPRLNGLPYLDKPTLNFAAEALAMNALGATATAARLPSLLFTLATIALTGWFASRFVQRGSGIVSAIALASCPIVVAFSRIVIFDAALSFFVALATMAFYIAIEGVDVEQAPSPAFGSSQEQEAAGRGRTARRWAAIAWLAIAFGVVTKGPIALLLPLLVAIPYGIWRKRARRIWSWLGLALFLAVLVPWIWAMTRAVPEFLEYALVTETMKRLATNELKRTGPVWYFIPLLIGGALPWFFVLASGGRGIWQRVRSADADEGFRAPRQIVVFALLWIVLPFIFFTISKSKRPQYLLPLMPGVALLVACHWSDLRARLRGSSAALIAYALFGLALFGALAGSFIKVAGGAHGPERDTALMFAIAFTAAAIVGAIFRQRRAIVLAALAAPVLLFPIAAAPALDAVANRRSSEQLANALEAKQRVRHVVAVRAYSGSLSFYLEQPVLLLSDDASELTSNYLLRSYDKYATPPDTPLKHVQELAHALSTCTDGTLFITEPREKEARATLSAHLPLAARGNKLEAYGPCNAVAVARAAGEGARPPQGARAPLSVRGTR